MTDSADREHLKEFSVKERAGNGGLACKIHPRGNWKTFRVLCHTC